ncbi:hypothetical protein ACOSQ4_016657 [Xanthoceras sorbifolium]
MVEEDGTTSLLVKFMEEVDIQLPTTIIDLIDLIKSLIRTLLEVHHSLKYGLVLDSVRMWKLEKGSRKKESSSRHHCYHSPPAIVANGIALLTSAVVKFSNLQVCLKGHYQIAV